MKKSALVRRLVLASSQVILCISLTAVASWAQQDPPPVGTRGGVRGDGAPVQIVVKLNGTPTAGATVTFKTSKSTITKTSDSEGVVAISLLPGHYTVSASSDVGSATKRIAVKASTTTLTVGLALAAKTP
jgi:hypothetical protein